MSRRPGAVKGNRSSVQKGSSATAAAAAAAAVYADDASGRDNTARLSHMTDEEEDSNYTQFDLTVEEVNVTLSVAKWMNGKGLLKDVDVKGVRGVIDQQHVQWDESMDPRSYRHVHQPGDFEIESFKLEDLLVTIYQPDGFRPFSVSIFQCDLPQLRKQWLFYDFLSANNMSGSYDDSLFTIHPRQSHGVSPSRQLSASGKSNGVGWKKMSRLRIDGLQIDHLNRGIEGPFSWIQQGNVDIIADVMFPEDAGDLDLGKMVQDIVGRVGETVSSSGITTTVRGYSSVLAYNPLLRAHTTVNNSDEESLEETDTFLSQCRPQFVSQHSTINTPSSPPPSLTNTSTTSPSTALPSSSDRFIVLDLHVTLNDVRATVPIFSKDLSYVNSALIRPIVAYINSRKTYIPIHCRVIKRQSEFDGSWTVFDSGLMDDLSAETYCAFARTVVDRQARRRRFRKVGLWTLQLLVQGLLMAMTGQVI